MKQEDIDLLLTYLSMALPYGVKLKKYNEDNSAVELYSINLEHKAIQYWSYKGGSLQIGGYGHLIRHDKLQFKPYLRPLSSMTEEEEKEFNEQMYKAKPYSDGKSYNVYEVIGLDIIYLNSHHFDYLGLIPKGLAIAITEENNPYKK